MMNARFLTLLFFSAALSIPQVGNAQPGTLLHPSQALQGYTGESYCTVPTEELAFEDFLAVLTKLPNDRLRFEKIRTEISRYCLATPYVYRMMELMVNANYEYDMLRLAYYYSADPGNFSRLLPYMEGATYRDAMELFLKERGQMLRADLEGQRQVMSPSEMQRVVATLTALDSDQSRLVVALEVIQNNNLLSDQVGKMMDLLKLASSRKELALQAYPLVYDPANFFMVYEKLPRKERTDIMTTLNSTPRPEEPAFVNTRRVGCTFRVAESEFMTHLGSLKAQARDDMRLQLATQLFANNCFNVTELRQAMEIFISDTDRLALAKAAYHHVFDPWNIYLVNTAFQRNNSVDALFLFLSEQ